MAQNYLPRRARRQSYIEALVLFCFALFAASAFQDRLARLTEVYPSFERYPRLSGGRASSRPFPALHDQIQRGMAFDFLRRRRTRAYGLTPSAVRSNWRGRGFAV